MFMILIIAILSFLYAPVAHAAILYFEPAEAVYNFEESFVQEMRIDTEGQNINIADIKVSYPKDVLTAEDFSNANSILTLWPLVPVYENGILSFTGGVPVGYKGSDGLLGKIIFRVKPPAKDGGYDPSVRKEIKFLPESKILLNDGAGTEAGVISQDAGFIVVEKFAEEIEDNWQREISLDDIAPEPFDVLISQDDSVYGGKYFITFSTVDNQTGIDHYEVFEYRGNKSWVNKNAQTPYLLENQKLDGIIEVRALDKAGNETIGEVRLPEAKNSPGFSARTLWIILAGAAVLLFIIFLFRFAKRRY